MERKIMVWGVTDDNMRQINEEAQSLAERLWPDEKLKLFMTCEDKPKVGGGANRTWITVVKPVED